MIQSVDAERFDRVATSGRTNPFRIACRDDTGRAVDVIAKATWAKCPASSLVREVIAAQLLGDLKIRVATPLLVNFDESFIESVRLAGKRDEADRLAAALRPAFGSRYLGSGFRTCTQHDALEMPQQAAEIWAFDQLVMNPDRLAIRANCLTDGTNIALIDHELSLNVVGLGLFLPPPWDEGAYLAAQAAENEHIFRHPLREAKFDLTSLEERWKAIAPEMYSEYADCIPPAWDDGQGTIDDIVKYLLTLRDNIESAFALLRSHMA